MRVGGQTYRVVATDDDQHVQHLAALVDRKYLEVVPPRGVTPQQAIFLTAMALAEDARAAAEEAREQRERAERLELERDRSTRVAARAREAVARLLQKVESVLGSTGALPDTARAAASTAEEPRDVRQSLPSDVRQSLPSDVRQPRPRDAAQAGPRSGARASVAPANETTPADGAPASDSVDIYELLGSPREPAPAIRTPIPADVRGGGLRLLRQSASWGPGAPSKSGPDDDSR